MDRPAPPGPAGPTCQHFLARNQPKEGANARDRSKRGSVARTGPGPGRSAPTPAGRPLLAVAIPSAHRTVIRLQRTAPTKKPHRSRPVAGPTGPTTAGRPVTPAAYKRPARGTSRSSSSVQDRARPAQLVFRFLPSFHFSTFLSLIFRI